MNAQFLYGSEEDANNLLSFIDSELENSSRYELPKNVFEKTLEQYKENEIYKSKQQYLTRTSVKLNLAKPYPASAFITIEPTVTLVA